MTAVEAVGLVLIAFALGTISGHGIGYARAMRVRSARYRRVGSPE